MKYAYTRSVADYEVLRNKSTVQNKLHFAIAGETAAEIIASRVSSKKDKMGLTSWRKSPQGKIMPSDVTIAKIRLLEKHGGAMNIDDIAVGISLPVEKVRQTLTTFDTDIVRVGHKLFDLLPRVHNGKVFRYTPTILEYEMGVLNADEDLPFFLTAFRNFWVDITLLDDDGNHYLLHRTKANKHAPFSHYSETKKLFSRLHMEEGDDLLFTCLDIATYTFLVRRESARERGKLKIAMRNAHLADMIADILLHSMSHYEMDMFLIRKYLFVYPYFSDPAPDCLRRVIAGDPRFLMTPRDRLFSWGGTPLSGNEFVIGLKKYYLYSSEGGYIPVLIQTDEEFEGKVAYCTHCDERLIWEENTGWRHTHDEMEWVDAYVPKAFLQFSEKRKKSH